MVDVAPILKQQFPNITIDAKVGRQMNDAGSIIDSFKNKGELGERIIIALGSNGSFNDKQLAQIITSLDSNKKIYLVNVRVPRPWESAVNDELAKIAARFRNIQVIDWYKASTNHDECRIHEHGWMNGKRKFIRIRFIPISILTTYMSAG